MASLCEVLDQRPELPGHPPTEATALLGRDAVLDSLGLVTLIVDVEQKLDEQLRVTATLADDRAMSRERSPFMTVGTLIDYVCEVVAGAWASDGG